MLFVFIIDYIATDVSLQQTKQHQCTFCGEGEMSCRRSPRRQLHGRSDAGKISRTVASFKLAWAPGFRGGGTRIEAPN